MSGLIDTNILLYAVNSEAPEHEPAREFLLSGIGSGEAWYLTEGIIYEFLRVATHRKVFHQPLSWEQAIRFLEPILSRSNVTVLGASEGHWTILAERLGSIRHPAGNLFFDIRTYVLMIEHSVKTIYSADSDFLQFNGITVINPYSRNH